MAEVEHTGGAAALGGCEGSLGDKHYGSAFRMSLEQLCEVRDELLRLHEGEVAAIKQDNLLLQEQLELGSHRLREVQAQLQEFRKRAKVSYPLIDLDESTEDLENEAVEGNDSSGGATCGAMCTGSALSNTPRCGGSVSAVTTAHSSGSAMVCSNSLSTDIGTFSSGAGDPEEPAIQKNCPKLGEDREIGPKLREDREIGPKLGEDREIWSSLADSDNMCAGAISKQTAESAESKEPVSEDDIGDSAILSSSIPGVPMTSMSILPSPVQEAQDLAGGRCVKVSAPPRRSSIIANDLGNTTAGGSSKESVGFIETLLESTETEQRDQRFHVLDYWTRDEVISQCITTSWESIPVAGTPRSLRRGSSQSLVDSIRPFEDSLKAYILHPTSKKRIVWDLLAAIFVAMDVCFVPLYFFDMPAFFFTVVGGWISRVFWALDIFATFLTGVYIRGMLEQKPRMIAKIYMRSWFVPDLLILSTQWLALCFEEGHSPGFWPVMTLLRGARVLRLLRLLRLLKVQMVLHEIGSKFSSHATLAMVTLFKFMLFSAIAAHFMACIWYGIGWSRRDGWVYRLQMDNVSIVRSYFTSLHWIITQFHGTSSFHPGNAQEYAFANIVWCSGLISFCYLLGLITNTMMQLDLVRLKDIRQQRLLCGYLKRHRISRTLALRAKIHFETVCNQRHEDQLEDDQTEAVLALLPQSLKLDISEELRAPMVSGYSFISDVREENPRIVRHLCHEALSEVRTQAGEDIFTTGDACSGMLFVMSGTTCYTLLRRPATPWRKGSHGSACSSSMRGSIIEPATMEFEAFALSGTPGDPSKRARSRWRRPSEHWLLQRSPSDANVSDIQLTPGDFLAEAALWTAWQYCGELSAVTPTTMLTLDSANFAAVISRDISAYSYSMRFARVVVKRLNQLDECSDLSRFHLVKSAVESEPFEVRTLSLDELGRVSEPKSMASIKRSLRRLEPLSSVSATGHYIFISHHKADAGTEAALMQEALERMIMEDQNCCGHFMKAPVFLDSEDLSDLSQLKQHVQKSCNLVLLLTKEVLDRPWVLVEIATAAGAGMNIVPVEVQKKDMTFNYPDEDYFKSVLDGKAFSEEARRLLLLEGISLAELEKTLRKVFKKIAVPFSPHKSANVRDAELTDILRRCHAAVESG